MIGIGIGITTSLWCSNLIPVYSDRTFASTGDANGVFNYIGTQYASGAWVNPVDSGQVAITSSSGVSTGTVGMWADRTISVFHTGDVAGSYITIDLGVGRSLLLNYYTYQSRGDVNYGRTPSWTLLASNNGTNWAVVDSQTNYAFGASVGAWAAIPVSNQVTAYRYWRLRSDAHTGFGNNLNGSELEFYGLFKFDGSVGSSSPFSFLFSQPGVSTVTTSITSGVDSSGCDLLLASLTDYAVRPVGTMTDSKGNVWYPVNDYVGADLRGMFFYSKPTSVGTGHTFTFTGGAGGSSFPTMVVLGFSGSNATPLDVHCAAPSTAPTSPHQPGSLSPSLIYSLMVTNLSENSAINPSIDSGFTIAPANVPYNPGTSFGHHVAYSVRSTTAAVNPSWSGNVGGNASMICFKP